MLPGSIRDPALAEATSAYGAAMASGPDYKAGSTTERTLDLLNQSAAFDPIWLHPSLLEIAGHFFEERFKLSSLLARTVRPGASAQALHADLARDSSDAPLLGFILMVDSFRAENGSTRFVPGSHRWPHVASAQLPDPLAEHAEETLACGDAGTMIVFDGAVWHSHTANLTQAPRRSIQGYFVRRSAQSGYDFRKRLLPDTRARMNPLARDPLCLDES